MSKELILGFYKEILDVAGCSVDPEGNVSARNPCDPSEVAPVLIDGKRLVIPTKQQLSEPDWSKRLAFHPLVENIMQEESVVLGKYRQILNQQLQAIISLTIITLMEVAGSVGDTKKLTPDQLEALTIFKDMDAKSMEAFIQLLKRMPIGSVTHTFVSIYLKKGGLVNGKKFSRAAIVGFPFYTELCKDQKEVYGVALRKKDKEGFKKVMEFLIPGIDIPGEYDSGTFAKQAPFLTALLTSAGRLMDELNSTMTLFGKFGGLDEHLFNLGWSEFLNEADKYVSSIRMIPALPGNLPEEVIPEPQATQVQVPATVMQPVTNQAPVLKPQPIDPSFGRPPSQSQLPQFGRAPSPTMQPMQLMQQQQPGVQVTSRGIDPASVAAAFGANTMQPQRGVFNRFTAPQQNNFGMSGPAHPFGYNSGYPTGGHI